MSLCTTSGTSWTYADMIVLCVGDPSAVRLEKRQGGIQSTWISTNFFLQPSRLPHTRFGICRHFSGLSAPTLGIVSETLYGSAPSRLAPPPVTSHLVRVALPIPSTGWTAPPRVPGRTQPQLRHSLAWCGTSLRPTASQEEPDLDALCTLADPPQDPTRNTADPDPLYASLTRMCLVRYRSIVSPLTHS